MLVELAPLLKRCQFCFQLYAFVVVEVNVIVNDLLSLLEGLEFGTMNGFFLEMSKENFHGSYGRASVFLSSVVDVDRTATIYWMRFDPRGLIGDIPR